MQIYNFSRIIIRILIAEISAILLKKGGRMLKKIFITCICFLFGFCIWNSQELIGQAEVVTPPGYHSYITTEDEVIDTWYGIAKGTYLINGTVGLVDAGKAKVNVSGTTNARSVCDEVKAAVYLDQSINGQTGYGTIGSYYYIAENARTCHGSEADVAVTSGWWYMVRGVHSVTEGSTTEITDTQTSAMQAS